MPTEVILPKVDMDMATGRIARWFAREGEAVKKGDLLFEIETDKATMEIDAPAGGTLRDVTGREGVDIPVGQPVAWIYAEGDEIARQQATPDAPIQPPEHEPTSAFTSPLWGGRAAGAGGGSDGPASTPTPSLRADPPHKAEGKLRASPLARRLARDGGIDLSSVSGSGPHGRIVKADVEAAGKGAADASAALAAAKPAPEAAKAAPPASSFPPSAHAPAPQLAKPPSDAAVLKLFAEGSYELVPHDTLRKTIARRLVEAKQSVPHFYLTADCELDALLALRAQINAAAPMRKTEKGEAPLYKLSVNDMVIKALALSLRDVPDANVSWTEGAMVRHRHADVGVAVSIPGGLITPIVRRAEEKPLSAIANEMRDLAARARARKLKPEEYQGGTTAVSNLGMFGVKSFSAVINPPHATILAVGAGEERAVVRKGEIKIATVMSVTLSTDHRAVDGALGAELIAAFRNYVENPMGMLV